MLWSSGDAHLVYRKFQGAGRQSSVPGGQGRGSGSTLCPTQVQQHSSSGGSDSPEGLLHPESSSRITSARYRGTWGFPAGVLSLGLVQDSGTSWLWLPLQPLASGCCLGISEVKLVPGPQTCTSFEQACGCRQGTEGLSGGLRKSLATDSHPGFPDSLFLSSAWFPSAVHQSGESPKVSSTLTPQLWLGMGTSYMTGPHKPSVYVNGQRQIYGVMRSVQMVGKGPLSAFSCLPFSSLQAMESFLQ